jgi:Arc/MetJ-type ribon-helix-helix transcriptional regulator
VKLSVSLPDEDVEFLDAYAVEQGVESRSAVLHRAVRLLRVSELTDAYEGAWEEWASSSDAALWESSAADGVADAAR